VAQAVAVMHHKQPLLYYVEIRVFQILVVEGAQEMQLEHLKVMAVQAVQEL
jgi:hypothetical protein